MTDTPEPIDAEFTEDGEAVDPHAPATMVVAEERTDITALSPDDIRDRALKFAEVRKHALLVTYPGDYVVHQQRGQAGTKAFMMADGAERIASFVGINWSGMELSDPEPIGDKDGHYMIKARAEFSWPMFGRSITVEGGASSAAPILSRGGRIKGADVNERDVRQFAQSNIIRAGVTRLMGMRNIPIEELPEKTADGRSFRDRVGKVDYGSGNKGGDTSSTDEKKQREEIGRWLMEMHDGEKQAAQDDLEQATAFEGTDGLVKGVRETRYLKGKRLDIAHDKIKRAYTDWSKAGK